MWLEQRHQNPSLIYGPSYCLKHTKTRSLTHFTPTGGIQMGSTSSKIPPSFFPNTPPPAIKMRDPAVQFPRPALSIFIRPETTDCLDSSFPILSCPFALCRTIGQTEYQQRHAGALHTAKPVQACPYCEGHNITRKRSAKIRMLLRSGWRGCGRRWRERWSV
jgi:hypothetical protein